MIFALFLFDVFRSMFYNISIKTTTLLIEVFMSGDFFSAFKAWCIGHNLEMPSGSTLKNSGRLKNLSHPKKKANVSYTYYPAVRSTTGADMVRCIWWDENERTEFFHFGESKTLSPEERKAQEQRIMANQIAKEKERDKQAEIAHKEYLSLGVQCVTQKYLQDKNVPAYFGVVYAQKAFEIRGTDGNLRFDVRKSDILIPAISLKKKFRTYQRIRFNGDKRLRCDSPKRGAMFPIGIWNPKTTKRVILVEGYSTGASLFKALQSIQECDDFAVLVCFDIHNILEVLVELKQDYRHIDVILATDYDLNSKTQAGLKTGVALSQQYDVKFVFPTKVRNGSDWNDLSFEMSNQEMGMHFIEQLDLIETQGLTFMQDEFEKLLTHRNSIKSCVA